MFNGALVFVGNVALLKLIMLLAIFSQKEKLTVLKLHSIIALCHSFRFKVFNNENLAKLSFSCNRYVVLLMFHCRNNMI